MQARTLGRAGQPAAAYNSQHVGPLQHALMPQRTACPLPAGPLQDERAAFKLSQFLMVVRAYTDPQQQQSGAAAGGSGGGGKQQQKKKRQQKGAAAGAGQQDAAAGVVHFLPEAECYQAAAQWSYAFPVADRLVGKDELQPCRVVMLISAAAAAAARQQLSELMKAAAQ